MKKLNLAIAFIAICFQFQLSVAQKFPVKWGKIDDAEIAMTKYDKDTSAAAVVICDVGEVNFSVSPSNNEFQLNFKQHTRIKILNRNGFKYATVEIPLYSKQKNKERAQSIDGVTYNFENGKKVKEKLKSKDIINEKIDENHTMVKFTLPNVQVGSIIEYEYEISSDYIFNLRTWYFQSDIPTMYSEFNTLIPEFFYYQKFEKGFYSYNQNISDNRSESFSFKYETMPQRGGGTMRGEETLPSTSISNKMVVTNIPAFKEEPFMTTAQNYIMKVEYELTRVQFPRSAVSYSAGTWESLNRELLNEEKFGVQLGKKSYFEDKVKPIIANCTTPLEKMKAIYQYVQNNIKWNERFSIYASDGVKDAFKNQKGNNAEINFILINMLQAAGIDANAVISSTRGNGYPNWVIPNTGQFNHILVNVMLDNKSYILDATDIYCPFNLLPPRTLNAQGRIIGENRWGNIRVDSSGSYSYMSSIDMAFNDKGELAGKIIYVNKGYAAYYNRKAMKAETNLDKYVEKNQLFTKTLDLQNYKFENVDSIEKPLREEYSFVYKNVTKNTDIIYFTPILDKIVEENPLKLTERVYPIDYNYPYDVTIMSKLTIPEGYKVAEKPANITMMLPSGKGKLTMNVSEVGNLIQVVLKFQILKTSFSPLEYKDLKELYAQLVAKQNEQIVLKKGN